MRHTLTTLIASTGLVLAGLAAPAPAPAASTVGAPSAHQARGTKPVRDLHDAVVKRDGKLYFKGRVDPGHGPVVVQKKNCSSTRCKWRVFKRVPTRGPMERWRVRIYAPRHGNWYWRGYVRAYGGYAKSWTHTYKTYVTRF